MTVTTTVTGSRILLLVISLLGVTACGGESSNTREPEGADTEHFLSDQQRALEQSKAVAAAMEKAALERASRTEDARDN
jgi:hypothetical protein